LTKSVRLCDCPGLVFPSLVSKPLQVLAGIYPIAQLQEPFRAIRYLAERIAIVDLLKIKHPTETDHNEKKIEWSPLDICEAWAIKRGYFTAKASRPDVNRASNELLRMALDGRLCLALRPKDYNQEIKYWQDHAETKELDEVVKNVEKTAHENKNINLACLTKSSEKKDENDETDYDETSDEDENEMMYLKDELDSDNDKNINTN
jgi:ribosome biogenesis GTPase A